MTLARIAIVGGGFSGTLVLANLVEKLSTPAAIDWFEERGALAAGAAYSTTDIEHLLNVPAEKMGAFAGLPRGFYQWLQSIEGKNEAQTLCPATEIGEGKFMPRALYARYLQSIVKHTLEKAAAKHIEVHIHKTRVTAADLKNEKLLLSTEDNQQVPADALVLATGNLKPRSFAFETLLGDDPRYIGNSWQSARDRLFPGQVGNFSAEENIVIIGTGLTTVDTILTLEKNGYKGTITTLSRNGKFPASHSHAKPYPQWQWLIKPSDASATALGLLTGLRREIRKAAQAGYDWRSVIDSIRPITPTLWQRLNAQEKQKAMKRLYTLWNIHRHRMAPEIHAVLETLTQNGRLKVIAGSIQNVAADKKSLNVTYKTRGHSKPQTLKAALLINCTGPDTDIAASTHVLLRHMHAQGLITTGMLKVGIEVTDKRTAKGTASDAIFPIGPLLVGELLECTAVPELREQALQVANGVIERLQSQKNL